MLSLFASLSPSLPLYGCCLGCPFSLPPSLSPSLSSALCFSLFSLFSVSPGREGGSFTFLNKCPPYVLTDTKVVADDASKKTFARSFAVRGCHFAAIDLCEKDGKLSASLLMQCCSASDCDEHPRPSSGKVAPSTPVTATPSSTSTSMFSSVFPSPSDVVAPKPPCEDQTVARMDTSRCGRELFSPEESSLFSRHRLGALTSQLSSTSWRTLSHMPFFPTLSLSEPAWARSTTHSCVPMPWR